MKGSAEGGGGGVVLSAILTTCRCGWSNRCCPVGCPAAGTTASPPRWSRFWSGWISLEPNLKCALLSTIFKAIKLSKLKLQGSLMWREAKPTKVGQLELSTLVDQQVLGFQVSVENLPPMTVRQAAKQLEKKELRGEAGSWSIMGYGRKRSP